MAESRYDPQRHHRGSIRLKGYDYAQAGAYFVTICTQNRACLFGDIVDGEMALNDAGQMVQAQWEQLPERFPMVKLDVNVVMPNHFHGIVVVVDSVGTVGAPLVGARGLVGARDTDVGGGDTLGDGAITGGATTGGVTTGEATTGEATTGEATTGGATTGGGATTRVAPTTLGDVVGAFKSLTTNAYIGGVREWGWPRFDGRLWQRNYYEHIIRNDDDLNRIRRYIETNPAQWEMDNENPDRRRSR